MSQAHNRITAYHWYLESAFWRERREHRIVERPRPSDSNICTPGVAGSKPTAGAIMG